MLQNTSVVHTLISEVAKTPVFTGFLGVWREVQSSLAAPAFLLVSQIVETMQGFETAPLHPGASHRRL